MPITKSTKKSLRQNEKRRKRNLVYKEKVKKLTKQVRKLISEKKIEETKKLIPQIYKALDKAAKEGIIKKNTSSRKKSRLAKSIFRLQQ